MDAKKHNYLSKNIKFVVNKFIYEYDLQDAGFSIIKKMKLLPEKEINYISSITDKKKKNIYIGNLINYKYPDLLKKVNEELINIRHAFYYYNNIKEEDIITIKKDAIFTLKQCKYLIYGKDNEYRFRLKNRYTSFYNFNHMEFYYANKQITTKGVSNEVSKDSELFIFLKKIFLMNETRNKFLYNELIKLREKYLRYEMDVESYREFKSGKIKLKTELAGHHLLLDNYISDDKKNIDISYNYLAIILPLINYLL
jgi:hypothetical protein